MGIMRPSTMIQREGSSLAVATLASPKTSSSVTRSQLHKVRSHATGLSDSTKVCQFFSLPIKCPSPGI
jgi:hypothetical protein